MTLPPPVPTLRNLHHLLWLVFAGRAPLLAETIVLAIRVNIIDRAAALTMYSILAAVPSLLAAFSVLGYVLTRVADAGVATGLQTDIRATTIDQITQWLHQTLPGVTWNPADFAAAMVKHRRTHGLLGFGAALWLGLGVFGRIDDAIRDLFGRKRRATVKAAGVMALLVAIAMLLAVLINLFGPLLEWSLHVATGTVKTLSFGWLDTKAAVVAATQSLPVAVVFYLMVRWSAKLHKRRRAVITAVGFGLVWALGQRIFTLYVKSVVKMDAVYGALTGVLALILWLFYANILFLAAVSLLATWDKRARDTESRSEL